MTAYSIRIYSASWRPSHSMYDAQTLDDLAPFERAVATRMDVPGHKYWDGRQWVPQKPRQLQAAEDAADRDRRMTDDASLWLNENATTLTDMIRRQPYAPLTLQDAANNSPRVREWASTVLPRLGAPEGTVETLTANPMQWLFRS